jgi:GNAT superfamily N-acetyltransferase
MKQLDGESFEFKADFGRRLSGAAKRTIGKPKGPIGADAEKPNDGDGDGLIFDNGPKEQPAPVKKPEKPADKPDSGAEPKPAATTSVDERVASRVSAPVPKDQPDEPDEPKPEFPQAISNEDIDAARYAFQSKWDEENPAPISSSPTGRPNAAYKKALREHEVARFVAMEEWESKARAFYARSQASRAREQASRVPDQVVPKADADKPDAPKVPASSSLILHMQEWDKDNPLPKETDPEFSIEKVPVLSGEEKIRLRVNYFNEWDLANPPPERTTFEAPTGNDAFDDAIGVPSSLTDFEIEKAYEEAVKAWEEASNKAKGDYLEAERERGQSAYNENSNRENNARAALERAVRDHEKKRKAVFESKKNELIEKTLISGDLDEEAFDAAAEAAFVERRKNADQKAAIIDATPQEISTDTESLLAGVSPSDFDVYGQDIDEAIDDWLAENPEPRREDFDSGDAGDREWGDVYYDWETKKTKVGEEARNSRDWEEFFDQLLNEPFVAVDGKNYSAEVQSTYNTGEGINVEFVLYQGVPPDRIAIGKGERIFKTDGTVEHKKLFVDEAFQGLGVGSAFNARNEEYYRRMGMSMIEVEGQSGQNTKGATHWPKNGFDWLNEDEQEKFLDILESALEEHRDEIMANKPGPIMATRNDWRPDPEEDMEVTSFPVLFEVFRSATEAKELARLVAAARNEQFGNHWIQARDLLFWSGAEQVFRNKNAAIRYMRPL